MDQVQHLICKNSSSLPPNPGSSLTPVQLTLRVNVSCPNATFTCDSGECISEKNVCDQVADCFDASDERKCTSSELDGNLDYGFLPGTCGQGFLICGTKCLPLARMCDFVIDCLDGSDERDCSKSKYKIMFRNGKRSSYAIPSRNLAFL
jgi:hypothetical protein